MKQKYDLTQGDVGRRLFGLTVPMVFGIFSLMAFNLIDTFFVAQLGTKELAAISFTFPVVLLIGSIAMGLGIAVASIVSRAFGENDVHKVKRTTTDGLILSFIIVAFFSLAGLMTIKPVFSLLGARAEVLDLVKEYMSIWYIGMFFLIVPMVGNHAIRASGDTISPAVIMVLSAGINVILDPLLIFGLMGFPRLELAGAAIATVIARAVALVTSFIVLHVRKHMIDFSLPSFQEVLDSWKKILYIGIPSAVGNIFMPLSTGILTRLVSQFGVAAVAAVGAGLRIEAFALMLTMAVSSALVPFVGQNWGAKHYERVCSAQILSSRFALVWGGVCVVFFMLSASGLAGLFSNESQVVIYITRYLWIVPFCYGFRGIRLLSIAFLNALNKPFKAITLNIVWMFVLYLPFALAGSYFYGLYGIFIGITFAYIVAGSISFTWARSLCAVPVRDN